MDQSDKGRAVGLIARFSRFYSLIDLRYDTEMAYRVIAERGKNANSPMSSKVVAASEDTKFMFSVICP